MKESLEDRRAAFWAELSEAAPELGIVASPGWDKEIPIGCSGRLRIKISFSQDKSSVYLVARSDEAYAFIEKHIRDLAQALRTTPGGATGEAAQRRWFRKNNPRACYTVKSQWPEAIRWFRAQHALFLRAANDIEGNR